ncbi:hypothetical protein B9Z19DRAFT_1064787 [Tuber borchii]|uniref:Uncharacterized protein n=1 Tax=Tuber borchii TaxID=42251 RepID=A0A2T6ZTG4_TUBBO|nr:hypothetical protein B9Z19DRAFT_1064787 [Tuber borchii]
MAWEDSIGRNIEVTEVEEEEVATETTYGDNIAAYAEPTLPQIHDHVLDAVSGQVQESDFHNQIREEMLQSESTQPDAPGGFLRSSRNRTMVVVAMDYKYHNHGQNGTGLGYRGYAIKIQAVDAEVPDYTGITDPGLRNEWSSKSTHRMKQWQGGNLNGGGGQQHRGSPGIIDHHTVNKMMLDVNDTSQGGQSRIDLARRS